MGRVSQIGVAGEPFPAHWGGNGQPQDVTNYELPESGDVNGRVTAVLGAGRGQCPMVSSTAGHDLVLANDDHASTGVAELAMTRAAVATVRRRRRLSVSLVFIRSSRSPARPPSRLRRAILCVVT